LHLHFKSKMTEKEREKRERLKFQKYFGEHLRKVRTAKKMTPAELARRCYLERSSIARIEMGRTMPTIFMLNKLCVGLDIEIKDFFEDFN
jgi:transcriptional regulator with XRE-family HTH domain